MIKILRRQTALLEQILLTLQLINAKIPPLTPRLISVSLLSERVGMSKIVYKAVLPSLPVVNDIQSQELTIEINGAFVEVLSLPKTQLVVNDLEAPQDASVKLSLVYVDDSGNKSPASDYSFVAADIFPPSVPGSVGAELTGELLDVDPSPAQ